MADAHAVELAPSQVVAVAGFTALGVLGAALVVAPAWLVLARRQVAAT